MNGELMPTRWPWPTILVAVFTVGSVYGILEVRMSSVERDVEQMSQHLTNIRREIQIEINSVRTGLQSNIQSIQGTIELLRVTMEGNGRVLVRLEGYAERASDHRSLSIHPGGGAQLQALETALDALKGEIEALQNRVVNITHRIRQIEDALPRHLPAGGD